MFRGVGSIDSRPNSVNTNLAGSPPPMTSDGHTAPEPRSGGLASVLKGLAGSRLSKLPPGATSVASTRMGDDGVTPAPHPMASASFNAPTAPLDFAATVDTLRSGTLDDRVAAAEALRREIADHARNNTLDVWKAAKDLIEPSRPVVARKAGWELLMECVKHPDSTDVERKEYFQSISKEASPDDFHMQLAALVELTRSGRDLSGFDYDVIPILTQWLAKVFDMLTVARKGSASAKRKQAGAPADEEKNLGKLFAFIGEVVKFSFSVANETAVSGLLDAVLDICMATSHEEDLTASIGVINAIVTFGSIPTDRLTGCVQVLSTIYCLVPNLEKASWNTLSILCRSHNGQETVRILLAILRDFAREGQKTRRNARGSLCVLQKLLSKMGEDGYPSVPFPLLVEGLSAVSQVSTSVSTRSTILSVINTLLANGSRRPHPLLLDEEWSDLLGIAAHCASSLPDPIDAPITPIPGTIRQAEHIRRLTEELYLTISHVEYFLRTDAPDFTQRHNCISFLTAVHRHVPDTTARIILDYFKEFRRCMPSDAQWEANITLVVKEFLKNSTYKLDTRLKALSLASDCYDMIVIVQDQLEPDAVLKLATLLVSTMSEETEPTVLDQAMSLVVRIAVAAPIATFDDIILKLRNMTNNEKLKQPMLSSTGGTLATLSTPPDSKPSITTTVAQPHDFGPEPTSCNAVVKALVDVFMQTMYLDARKAASVYNLLVVTAKCKTCELDARLTAMKLLILLRAEWGNEIFVGSDSDSERMASYLGRSASSRTRKHGEEHSLLQRSRPGAVISKAMPAGFSQPAGKLPPYRELWMAPDVDALLEPVSPKSSPLLLSFIDDDAIGAADAASGTCGRVVLNISSWLDVVLTVLQQGADWELYSFILCYLPSQLSNHALVQGTIPQIQKLRRVVCDQIKNNTFKKPPDTSGLRLSDVALCLFQLLTNIISYHRHFNKQEEDEIVNTFFMGLNSWDRSYRCCIHALSVCVHELPLSMSRALAPILTRMAQIVSQPAVSIHILEFLASTSHAPGLYSHFREDEYRIVFGICFRYLQDVRDKKRSQRVVDASSTSTHPSANTDPFSAASSTSEALPQYVYALAYNVIIFWFLRIPLADRASYVTMITKQLFSDVGGPEAVEDKAVTTLDFMQRLAFADNNESSDDPLFTEDRFGPISCKTWLAGKSIITIRQAVSTGWAQVTKRQPSATSSFTIRESLRPPPPHQITSSTRPARDGNPNADIQILPSHLLVHLLNFMPQPEGLRPIPLPDDEHVKRSIRLFDLNSSVDGHKVGVIYVGEGQATEAEILANVTGSREYVQLLDGLGTLTRLKGASFNTQGLDREYDTDGKYTFCWRDKVTEIVFHVTTQMPTNLEDDPLCINKKKHIGNDYVHIIYNDSGRPFKFDTFPGDFNFVKIIITPESRTTFTTSRLKTTANMRESFYKVHVVCKQGFPEISPASETKMVSLERLPEFVRLLALNASIFSNVWAHRDGGEHVSSWSCRLREIRRLRERYGGKHPAGGSTSATGSRSVSGSNSAITSNTATTNTSTAPTAAAAVSGSGSGTMRDGFSNFRRSSVTTTFAGSGGATTTAGSGGGGGGVDQSSTLFRTVSSSAVQTLSSEVHHSSTMGEGSALASGVIGSGVALSGGGGESAVENLDFTKWA